MRVSIELEHPSFKYLVINQHTGEVLGTFSRRDLATAWCKRQGHTINSFGATTAGKTAELPKRPF